ncbi:MAG: ABC transporter ATP-binding protein [Bacteroidales bacterium]|nr:ABC transporter ATP-binding protein [Bacteroidales bacterium]
MKNIVEVNDVYLSYKYTQAQALKHFIINRKKEKKVKYFQAIKGVSFNVEKGINLGIIGSNGSGKSTLLRLLANTLAPDKGSIVNNSQSVSLLSLGVGFKPDLTGHENIYINGLLLGLSRTEIDQKMDEIIDFSELGDFIYNPVRTYSSGMKSRLSFSIAINVDPDLLIVDELFSVGDERFKEKSSSRMESMLKDNRTVIMVSHNLSSIERYCSKVIWIEDGRVFKMGEPKNIIPMYKEYMKIK